MVKEMYTNKKVYKESVVVTGACHDCGGRCVHKIHVRDGKIVRLETDDGEDPQYRSCLRGRAYRQRVYAPNRLKYPLKRVGQRGEGKFERISWNEALDLVANELKRVKEIYGPSAILCISENSSPGHVHTREAMERLFNLFGGCTQKWGFPSSEGSRFASRVTYGTLVTGHTRDDLINSRMIIMWGWNPAVSIAGTDTRFYLAKAKEAGARIIGVDPRFTESVAVFADKWIPVRPGTDTAMLIAMAYVMIEEDLQDQKFLDTYTIGFDKYKDYVLGVEDGIPKTPAWAETISGVPTAIIYSLAREYATTKPAALIPGFSIGRNAYGEQCHRAVHALVAMTGNIGIHGGNPAGHIYSAVDVRMPIGENPLECGLLSLEESLDTAFKSQYRVHPCKLWDSILKGKAGGYPADFKLLYVNISNCLNQYVNINKAVEALQELEFIVIHEQFMTPTARFADVVLPVNTHLERNDFYRPTYPAFYYLFTKKIIEPLYESRSDFDIAVDLAPRLGIPNYSEKKEDEWLREIIRISPDISKYITDYEGFKQKGIWKVRFNQPVIPFQLQIEDPQNNPFPTPSGKIEIYSQRLADLNNPQIPPIPKYIENWESCNDSLAERYPLQLITPHSRRRANSCFENIPWLVETEHQAIMINSADAQVRGINSGDQVRVFNERGVMMISANVTERIKPGVVGINQGAWYSPDKAGIDMGGSPNILTKDDHSPAGAFPYNNCLVQVEKSKR